ncbi:hypothetical protein GGE65_000136 [Skermanella aerolata]|uniref:hypothetical protein n=1 Tax=Skermanella aerolata TaxID=393310 RepID=UPI0005CA43C2|nr:hypothetical protein [Skermanella aerolata]KJB93646.1 hypothetical protein N826_15435 [Skermanella aerolata KACC 11604]
MKQAALYRKTEPEIRPCSEFDYSDRIGTSNEGDWSLRRRFAFLISAALASWAVVGLVGYGVYSLFA